MSFVTLVSAELAFPFFESPLPITVEIEVVPARGLESAALTFAPAFASLADGARRFVGAAACAAELPPFATETSALGVFAIADFFKR